MKLSKQITVRMTPSYFKDVKRLASENRVGIAELFRIALDEWSVRYDKREVGRWVWDADR